MKIERTKIKDKNGKLIDISIFYDNINELGNLYLSNENIKNLPSTYAINNINDFRKLGIVDEFNERFFEIAIKSGLAVGIIKTQKELNELSEKYNIPKIIINRRGSKVRGFSFRSMIFIFPSVMNKIEELKFIIEHESLHFFFKQTNLSEITRNETSIFHYKSMIKKLPNEVKEDIRIYSIQKYYKENLKLEELLVRYFTEKDFYEKIVKHIDLRIFLQPILSKGKYSKVNKRKAISAVLILLNRFENNKTKLKNLIKELKSLKIKK